MIIFTAGAAVMATVSGLIGASLVKSPAQLAAETAAPARSVIVAPVVRQVLTESIVIRGTFAQGASYSFVPTSVAGTAGNPGGGGLVVTGVYAHTGNEVHSGEVLAEVSDRPVYILSGPYRLWRDLVPGESGKDVMELQAALAKLGYGSGSDYYGYFGPGTEAAVQAFYSQIGYAPPVERVTAGKKTETEAYVPMSEAWFVPELPATVLTLSAVSGQTVSSSLITIADGGLRLIGDLDPSDESLVKTGMQVDVYSDVTGYTGTGRITGIGAEVQPSASSGGGAAYIPVQIDPARSWPESLNGQNVQLTITAVTTGSAVLAVPVAALSYGASGQALVLIETASGAEHRDIVRVGMSAGGFVQVQPVDGVLSPGTQVVVGQ
jgi:peptidoglycan hydrolase-like protein with peptidoglycan-binding domain